MQISPRSIARVSARNPWKVVGVWAVLFVISMGLTSALLSGALTTEAGITANPDSSKGLTILEERLRGPTTIDEAVVIRSAALTTDSAMFRNYVSDIAQRIRSLGPDVVKVDSVADYTQGPNAPFLISSDRRTAIIPFTMAGSINDATNNIEAVQAAVHEAPEDGFEVYTAGNASVGHDFNKASEEDLARGETVGGLIAIVILILVFGAVVAALVPLLVAVLAIVAALGATALLGQAFEFSFFVTNMITMMGLAVGIDYTLFIVSRFREERTRGHAVLDAVDIASSTAGRAVLFSGLTVVIALAGMFIVPSTIYRSLAAGAIFGVGFAILASLTLLPALLSLLGDKVGALRLPFVQKAQVEFDEERSGGFWDRVARTVMRYPVIGVVGVTVLLVAATIPYFDINLGSAGVSTLPDTFQSKRGFEILEEDFAGGHVYPAEIVIDGNVGASTGVPAAVERLRALIEGDAVFGPSTFTTNRTEDAGVVSVQMAIDPYADEANAAIERLRDEYVPQAFADMPVAVYVTGLTAVNVDSLSITADYTPYVFVFVLGLSFLLLMLVFRSIVVPAKAILMNLLSVGAAYGLIVLVFQKGFAHEIFGFQQVETVEFWLPLFLFSVLFGLSMDYHVFLLSRIRERYDETGDNAGAVAYGLRTTGRLITGAALIMVAVFGGFAMGSLVMLQQVGFGLGVAVLIDATVIRSILVPASMRLLGDWNWYLPPVLSWLPHFGIDEREPHLRAGPERA
ncbi:MAG TPA: MMPL family transporter [Dehalococcoidia bacterium]|nr:MMPL family transporter [Dehalococcoidia bacterium]